MFDCRRDYELIGGHVNANTLKLNKNTTRPDDDGTFHEFPSTTCTRSVLDIDEEQLMYVGVASDGLESYVRNSIDVIDPKDVIRELAAIKNPAGEFLVRRFQKMDKEYTAQGFENQDDIAVALINVDCYRATIEANKEG